jgi:NADH-quinone oxidoreductase subunit F
LTQPVLTRNIARGGGTTWIDAYEANGGYAGLRKAVAMAPEDVIKLVTDAKLRGRGGAGFPTGMKWSSILPIAECARPRYIACNFDEMEPGTFKDRFLVEGDPHQLIEGILIAGWACQCNVGFIFIRDEYRVAESILRRAMDEATGRGLLGPNVLGTGWDFKLDIHSSAGRYMCGEETGLLNALEGRPSQPRSKPPYPGTSGLWGKPTVVNNVETLCCVPHIVERGAEWFIGLGKAKDSGTKIYGASGHVARPGCWELPMGSTLREIVEEQAGGMLDGYALRAVLPGGASTKFMNEGQMDIPLDFDSLKEHGLFLGTGTAIVIDDRACPVGLLANLAMFYARESCGWCTPCREGLPWIEKLIRAIEEGRGEDGDIDLVLDLIRNIGPNTYCALATGAMFPIESGIEMFRDSFEEHIALGRCPNLALNT